MMTLLSIALLTFFAVGVIGWLWIVVLAFSDGETLWGIGCLIIPPLTFVYGLLNYQEAKIPFWIVTAGFTFNILLRIVATALTASG